MPNPPVIYDSQDPHLPNIPTSLFHTNESDDFSEDEYGKDDDDNQENEPNPDVTPTVTGISRTSTSTAPHKRKKRKKRQHSNRRYSNTGYSSSQARERISWEPGIDIHSTDVILASLGSAVTITDYNATRYRVERIDVETNMRMDAAAAASETDGDEEEYCESDEKFGKSRLKAKTENGINKLNDLLRSRPGWSKVRWINVNGLSWETIVTLANHFNLHKLAIEDLIDIPTRTKIDFYPDCLFGVIAMAKLVKETKMEREEDDMHPWLSFLSTKEKTDHDGKFDHSSTEDYTDIVESMTIDERLSKFYKIRHLNDSFKQTMNSKGKESKRKMRYTRYLNSQKPLSYRNLFVGIEQCSFFVLDNGVVLTFFESSGDDVENAILSRINKDETTLKKSCDATILLQNILDSIVDVTYPILTAYRKRLDEFEIEALMSPNLSHTRALHLLYGELENLRSSILPVTAMISSLREVAQANHAKLQPHELYDGDRMTAHWAKSTNRSVGFVSPMSEIYFADIVDHTLMFSSEIEGMINNTQNLIDLIFNTISTDTNSSMRQLSWITVIFLPMSFWTGYYGMNFEIFGNLKHNVSYYWMIAVPFSFGLVTLLTWSVVKNYFKKVNRFALDLIFILNARLRRKKRQTVPTTARSVVQQESQPETV